MSTMRAIESIASRSKRKNLGYFYSTQWSVIFNFLAIFLIHSVISSNFLR